MKRKPKPEKRGYCPKHGLVPLPHSCGFEEEAAASVSLDKGDGGTRPCHGCNYDHGGYEHDVGCTRRPMTAAEREFIEAWLASANDVDWLDRWHVACRALRAEREKGGR